jgi:hypothetical protein
MNWAIARYSYRPTNDLSGIFVTGVLDHDRLGRETYASSAYHNAGSATPVWGNLIPAPGCAEATLMENGWVTSHVVERGCPDRGFLFDLPEGIKAPHGLPVVIIGTGGW